MSENLMDKVPGEESGLKNRDFVEEITVVDKSGGIHRFKGTAELMQWQEEVHADKNNP